MKNEIIFFGWGTGLLIAYWGIGIMHGVFGAFVPILLLWPLFRHSMLGTGDIKLFSVVGLFYGSRFILQVMMAAFFLAAIMSIIHIAIHGNLKIRLKYLANYMSDYFKTREVKEYYKILRDGQEPAIHFTLAILGAYIAAVCGLIPG